MLVSFHAGSVYATFSDPQTVQLGSWECRYHCLICRVLAGVVKIAIRLWHAHRTSVPKTRTLNSRWQYSVFADNAPYAKPWWETMWD